MDSCDTCDFDWETGRDELCLLLETLAPRFRVDFAAFGNTHGRPGGWNAGQYLAHVRDVTDFFVERIERVVRCDRPSMSAVDFRAMARADGYGIDVDPAAIERSMLTAAELLRSLNDEQLARVGVGSGGERTVLFLAQRLAHEAVHHYQDLASLQASHNPESS